MHNHNNNPTGHDSKMMRFMMLGCLLPVIILAFSGSGTGRSSLWWLLGAGAVMLGVHAFAMRGHGGQKPGSLVDSQMRSDSTASQADPSKITQTDSHSTSDYHNHH